VKGLIALDELVRGTSECSLLVLLDSLISQNIDYSTSRRSLWRYLETTLVEIPNGYKI
jgi:hypothetical protein